VGFIDAVMALYGNYAKFSGRASRSEYWWAFLYFILLYVGLLIGTSVDLGALGSLLTLALSLLVLGTCIPMISVSVRRLHDFDKSGWLYLIGLIPIVSLYLLYLYVQPGTRGSNRFGPDPLDRDETGKQTNVRQPMMKPPKVKQAKVRPARGKRKSGPQTMGTPVPGTHTRIFI
jgi:uncharacterized membrane protein YhaH (DUF805 family)